MVYSVFYMGGVIYITFLQLTEGIQMVIIELE